MEDLILPPLVMAVEAGNTQTVRQVIDECADINAQSVSRDTVLTLSPSCVDGWLGSWPGGGPAGMARETARWRLWTYKDLEEEEVLVLLVGAHPGGLAAFQTIQARKMLVEEYLPAVGQTLGDQPLDDGLQEVQARRYVCPGRLDLAVMG